MLHGALNEVDRFKEEIRIAYMERRLPTELQGLSE
jgi:hypothetical protein